MLGVAPPEHDVGGRILILLMHAFGVVILGAALAASMEGEVAPGAVILYAILGMFGLGGAVYIAEGLRRFECWAWFFAMGWLVPPWLAVLFGLLFEPLGEETLATVAAGMMLTGAVHYLWARRREFWTNAKLEARRPPPRAVTPEWRAARLAGIAAEAGRVQRRASPRPGALWMRRTSA